MNDLYDEFLKAIKIMGLNANYTERDLHNQFRILSKKWHPDRNPSNPDSKDIFQKINSAYRFLLFDVRYRDFLDSVLTLQGKYIDHKEIVRVCRITLEQLDEVETNYQLNQLKETFNQKIQDIKRKRLLPDERNNLLNFIRSYLNNSSQTIQEIVHEYSKQAEEIDSLSMLQQLKREFKDRIAIELSQEKRKKDNYIPLKETLKRSYVSGFYKYAANASFEEIQEAYKLFLLLLTILDKSRYDTIEQVYYDLKDVDYNYSKEEFAKYSLYYLNQSGRIQIRSFQEVNQVMKKGTVLRSGGIDREKQVFVNAFLLKYHEFAAHSKIQDILNDQELFQETFQMLEEIPVENLNAIYFPLIYANYQDKIHIMKASMFINDPNHIMISYDTGELYLLGEENKNYFLIPLIVTKNKEFRVIQRSWIRGSYTSVVNFLTMARPTNGLMLQVQNTNRYKIADNPNTNHLYYTPELILAGTNNQDTFFSFIASGDSLFNLSPNSQLTITKPTKIYQDKDIVLAEFMNFIRREVAKPKEELKKI